MKKLEAQHVLPVLEDTTQRISPSCVGKRLIAILLFSFCLVALFHLAAIPVVTKGYEREMGMDLRLVCVPRC